MSFRTGFVAAALGALTLVACGGSDTRLSATGEHPARGANADVRVARTPAGNRMVNLDVRWLPPPDRIDPTANAYGVWIVPELGQPIPAGLLEYDQGDRSGNLAIVTPFDRFRIIITPQNREQLQRPGDVVVIQQEVVS
jgi:hypothetical protein